VLPSVKKNKNKIPQKKNTKKTPQKKTIKKPMGKS